MLNWPVRLMTQELKDAEMKEKRREGGFVRKKMWGGNFGPKQRQLPAAGKQKQEEQKGSVGWKVFQERWSLSISDAGARPVRLPASPAVAAPRMAGPGRSVTANACSQLSKINSKQSLRLQHPSQNMPAVPSTPELLVPLRQRAPSRVRHARPSKALVCNAGMSAACSQGN